jgi:CRP-like cAMP-binding protein
MQAADHFRRIPLFSDLAPDEIVDVLRIARVVAFAPGKLICARGERGDCAYVIEQGEAAVRAVDEAGIPFVIARIGPGEVVGELSLVDGHPRSADVIATTEVRGYRIDRAELDALRRAMHPAAFKILRRIAITVSDRLRDVNDAIGEALAQSKNAAGAPEGRVSDPGKATRAGQRASRELGRASLPEPPRRSGAAARASRESSAKPAAPKRAAPKPAAQEPEPAKGSLWSSMLSRLSGAPWK